MTKLSELRSQLRTGELEAKLAEAKGAPAALRQYSISPGGDDALIRFGQHKGLQLSLIAKRDPAYLNWILGNDFPSELKDVVREVLARRDGSEMDKATRELEAAFKGMAPDERAKKSEEARRVIAFAEELKKGKRK